MRAPRTVDPHSRLCGHTETFPRRNRESDYFITNRLAKSACKPARNIENFHFNRTTPLALPLTRPLYVHFQIAPLLHTVSLAYDEHNAVYRYDDVCAFPGPDRKSRISLVSTHRVASEMRGCSSPIPSSSTAHYGSHSSLFLSIFALLRISRAGLCAVSILERSFD